MNEEGKCEQSSNLEVTNANALYGAQEQELWKVSDFPQKFPIFQLFWNTSEISETVHSNSEMDLTYNYTKAVIEI